MIIVLNHDYAQHNPQTELYHGKMVPCFENPTRLKTIQACFVANGHNEFIKPNDYGLAPILAVHPEHYVTFLQNAWHQWEAAGNEGEILPYVWPAPGLKRLTHDNFDAKLGQYAFSGDTPIVAGTWNAIYQGAQAALSAVDLISKGAPAAFALTRPPGHHAHAALFGGYCFLNNAAIAAQSALDKGYGRVAILDVDYHHGNGTQDIFYQRDDVLTISLHGCPKTNFPYYLGYAEEVGEGKGEGFNLNLPLKDGTTFEQWHAAYEQAANKIKDFDANLLIVPLGVDTFENDPISNFKFKTQDYLTLGSVIANLNLPTIFVMEGGYDVAPLGQNVFNVIAGYEQKLTCSGT